MSHSATDWAWEVLRASELPATRRIVLLALADCHNRLTGRCDPSLDLLIQKTGLDRHSIPKSIRDLEAAGLILVNRAFGKRSTFELQMNVIPGAEDSRTSGENNTAPSGEKRTASSGENNTSGVFGTSGENNTTPVGKTPPLPVGKSAHNPGIKPGMYQEESVITPLPPTRQGELAILLRHRLVDVTSMNPHLLTWVENGLTDAEAIEAVERARQHKPEPERLPAAYLHRVIESVVAERNQQMAFSTGQPRRPYEPRKSVEQQNREAAERAKVLLFGDRSNVIEGDFHAGK